MLLFEGKICHRIIMKEKIHSVIWIPFLIKKKNKRNKIDLAKHLKVFGRMKNKNNHLSIRRKKRFKNSIKELL